MTLSTMHQPHLEFAFECRLMFTRVFSIPQVHNGWFRSAVLVDEGTFEGPGPSKVATPSPTTITTSARNRHSRRPRASTTG